MINNILRAKELFSPDYVQQKSRTMNNILHAKELITAIIAMITAIKYSYYTYDYRCNSYMIAML